jgi:predicted nucleotidyltransferase
MHELGEYRDKIVPVLQPYGIKQVAIFGSVARGEDTPESDVDVLVEFEEPPQKPLSFFTLLRLERELAARLGKTVDLVSARGLNRHIRPYIEEEMVVLYEKAG